MSRPTADLYRERLSPSLWVLVTAAVSAPMAALVFAPIDATLALVVGVVVAIAVVAALIGAAPVIRVTEDTLFVGRAHIAVSLLGEPEAVEEEAARMLRGPGLSGTAWHLFRPGVDSIVRVPLHDADDPVTEWVFSTRTPERVVAAVRRAQLPVTSVTGS